MLQIVSRGNIQAAGTAQVGENSVTVTTEMCPNGRLLVYGVTTESEIIADSLDLKLDVCQNKKVFKTFLCFSAAWLAWWSEACLKSGRPGFDPHRLCQGTASLA